MTLLASAVSLGTPGVTSRVLRHLGHDKLVWLSGSLDLSHLGGKLNVAHDPGVMSHGERVGLGPK